MLIPLLEALAEKEETIVRQKAVESLVQVGKSMPASTLQSEMKELLKRLSGGDFFPSRISAAGLFATVYPSTPPAMRAPLRKMYEQSNTSSNLGVLVNPASLTPGRPVKGLTSRPTPHSSRIWAPCATHSPT